MTLVLASRAHRLLDDPVLAQELYDQAVAIGQPLGYRRLLSAEWPRAGQTQDDSSGALERPGAADDAPPAANGHAAASPLQPSTPRQVDLQAEALSYRELEILSLMSFGLSNRDIGERLYISENTVRSHARRIFVKLGARNRSDAVYKARLLGLLDLRRHGVN